MKTIRGIRNLWLNYYNFPVSLLPDNWYVSDPLGQSQINEISLSEILEKHFKKFRKERRRMKKK